MNDKSALLGQLKIDRAPEPESRSPWVWITGAVVLLALAGGAWWLLKPAAAMPVKVAAARPLASAPAGASVLDASGYVVARRQATVSSKITGKVVELLIEEGMRVEDNQVLARIDDSNVQAQLSLSQSQLEASRAALTEVRVQLAEAERQLRRNRELGARQLVSQAALETSQATVDQLKAQLESTQRAVTVADRTVDVQQRNLDDTIVRAPFAGVITVKNAQPGEMISPLSAGGAGTRTGIGTLVDMESLEIEVDVNENFINRVQPAQPVTAKLNAYPDWEIPAEVIAVIPTADRSKATMKVRIGLRVKDPRVLPEMGVRVSFMDEPRAAASAEPPKGVLIPADAIHAGTAGNVVFVVADGKVERRAVTLGARRSDGQQILAGLRQGEQVALGDLAKLEDGASVTVEP